MDVKWNNHVVILFEKGKDDSIAAALKFYIESEFDPCDVIAIDNVSYTNTVVRLAQDGIHRVAVRYARRLLAATSAKREQRALQRIREQNKEKNVSSTEKSSKNPEVTRVLNVFKRFDPVMVICTSPYSLRLSLRAKLLYGKDVHVVGAVTDFALDPAFVYLSADGYFVENPEIKQKLIKFGVDAARVSVIGMPSLQADTSMSKEDKRHALGITNDLPVVVVNGGEYGTDTLRDDVVLLMRNKKDYNLIIITANKKSRRFYMDLPEFVAGVLINDTLDESILDVADILVTMPSSKPIFAAFMRGVSVVVAQHVTTHEHEVRRYLVKRALVMPTRTPMETLFAVEELLVDATREEEFRNRGETYAAMSLRDIDNMVPQIEAEETLQIDGGAQTDGDQPQ